MGQYGHVSGLVLLLRRLGQSSNCVIDFARWRFDVPTQSEPVSPPPMTTDVLARRENLLRHLVAGIDAVLLRQEFHRVMDAREIAARHGKIARRFGAAGQREPRHIRLRAPRPKRPCRRDAWAEFDALDRHLRHAPVDQVPFHLEIGNAVAEQPADTIGLLVEHDIVARTRELLRAREPRRPRAHDGDAAPGLCSRGAVGAPSLLPIPCR
jgi:hypothetical protein